VNGWGGGRSCQRLVTGNGGWWAQGMEVFVLHPRGHRGDGTVENGCTIPLDWELQLGSQVTNRWNPYRLDRPFPKPTQPVSRADLTKKKETALMSLMVGSAILMLLGCASGSAGLNWRMACQPHVAQPCDIQWIFYSLKSMLVTKQVDIHVLNYALQLWYLTFH